MKQSNQQNDDAFPHNHPDQALSLCWHLLQEGAQRRRNDFHLCTIAVQQPSSPPLIATVVNRHCDPNLGIIRFHTDHRKAQTQQIKINKNISMLFYSQRLKLQIRMQATTSLHHMDDLCAEVWSQSAPISKQCYLPTETEQPSAASTTTDNPFNIHAGFQNFCIIENQIQIMDVLYLCVTGHRRICFEHLGGHWTHRYLNA